MVGFLPATDPRMLSTIEAVQKQLMTPEGLRTELAGLRFERCEEVDRDVSEGLYHRGPSTTVQVLAFKP